MELTCDDCLEDFTSRREVSICPKCRKSQKAEKYENGDQTANIWKTVSSRGFKSQEEINEFQIVKKDHKILTGFDLPKLKEEIKK